MEKQVLETLTMDISFDNVSSSLQFDTEEQIKEDLMFDFEQMEYVIIANDDYLN